MYCSDYDYNALDPVHVGLGAPMRARAYIAPGARRGSNNPCDDIRFAAMNPRCRELNGGAPAPPRPAPPKVAPPKVKPVTIVDPVDIPMPILKMDPTPTRPPVAPPTPAKPMVTPAPGPDPIVTRVEDLIGPDPSVDLEPTVISVGGGGWGGGPPQALAPTGSTDVSLQAGDVILEAPEETERGFGMLEAAMAAGLAWVLSQAYARRRR